MAAESGALQVEVAIAWPELQVVVRLELQAGATVSDAIEASGLGKRFPQLDIRPDRLGVFGEKKRPDHALRNGDRVEIYRPLEVDPKTARRLAAEAERSGRTTR
ncbi:MAG: RnfH family protein [Xanthomonadaceae bacterium]|nr:RnfH family protein [Xanthomonadaceae bacterium]